MKTRTVVEFEAWLAAAEKGARFAYVIGGWIPAGCAVAQAVRQAHQAGLVSPVQGKQDGERAYLAERTGKKVPDAVLPRLSIAAQVHDIDQRARRGEGADAVLSVLESAAFAGRACPTAKQIADQTGQSIHAVRSALADLDRRGLISLQMMQVGLMPVRVVDVRSIGRCTAVPKMAVRGLGLAA